MKRLIPLMISAPLLVACGSDSDSESGAENNPALPTFNFASTSNAQASAISQQGSALVIGLQQELDSLVGSPAYNKSGNTETWVYSEGSTSITFEYKDGAEQDTWRLILNGTDDGETYNNWVAVSMTQSDDGQSGSIETYFDNDSQVETRLLMSANRLESLEYDEQGDTVERVLILTQSDTMGRMLFQDGDSAFDAVTWNGEQVTTYSNCSGTFAAAETADLGTICNTNVAIIEERPGKVLESSVDEEPKREAIKR